MKCYICGNEKKPLWEMLMIKALRPYGICHDCYKNRRFEKYMSLREKIKDFFNIL